MQNILEKKLKNGAMISLKMFLVAILTLLLLIPSAYIEDVMYQRHGYSLEAADSVEESWGGKQIFKGTAFSVPVTVRLNKSSSYQRMVHVLPKESDIKVEIIPEIRKRGIFKVILYKAVIQSSETIDLSELTKSIAKNETINWNKAFLSVGLQSLVGILEAPKIIVNGKELQEIKNTEVNLPFNVKLASNYPTSDQEKKFSVQTTLSLAGSDLFSIWPVAQDTQVTMISKWPHPSFSGTLPQTHDITDAGFEAHWKIPEITRNIPNIIYDAQVEKYFYNDETRDYSRNAAIIQLGIKDPVDVYRLNRRAIKYVILFVSMTFLLFFVFEIIGKKSVHPLQYTLAGLAQCLFYLLLLALSEHISFLLSYSIAAGVICSLCAYYASGFIGGRKQLLLFTTNLVGLYAYLYIALNAEDFALLLGSAGLVLVLGFVMTMTRKFKFDSVQNGGSASA